MALIIILSVTYALFGAYAENNGIIIRSQYWSLYGLMFGYVLGLATSMMINK